MHLKKPLLTYLQHESFVPLLQTSAFHRSPLFPLLQALSQMPFGGEGAEGVTLAKPALKLSGRERAVLTEAAPAGKAEVKGAAL